MAANEPASEAQRRALTKWGVSEKAASDPGLTKPQASAWMDELVGVHRDGRPAREGLHHVPPAAAARPSPAPVAPAPAGRELARTAGPAPVATWGYTTEQVALIKAAHGAASLNDADFTRFLYTARRLGLDPVARQIYAVVYPGEHGPELSIQTGIDGYRSVAARSGELDGIDAPVFGGEVESDGVKHPSTASVTVWRKGGSHGFTATVRWEERRKKRGDGQLTRFWREQPYTMLGKCAESAALRMGFAADLSGVYTEDEMPPESEHQRLPGPVSPDNPVPLSEERKRRAIDADPGPAPAPAPAEAAPAEADPKASMLEALAGFTDPKSRELVTVALQIAGAKALADLPLDRLEKLLDTLARGSG